MAVVGVAGLAAVHLANGVGEFLLSLLGVLRLVSGGLRCGCRGGLAAGRLLGGGHVVGLHREGLGVVYLVRIRQVDVEDA